MYNVNSRLKVYWNFRNRRSENRYKRPHWPSFFKTSSTVSLNEHWTKIYFSRHMFLPGYLKSRVVQFYSDLPGLLITGDNRRTSRWEILHRKITRPWKGKLLGLGDSPSFRALLASRISRGHFFLANFFRVTHDGLSERGTTRSLQSNQVKRTPQDYINELIIWILNSLVIPKINIKLTLFKH